MKFHLICRYTIVCLLMVGLNTMGSASDKKLLESIKAMEREHNLKIVSHFELTGSVQRAQKVPDHFNLSVSPVSSEGATIAWSSYPVPYRDEKVPFITVESLREGIQPVLVEGRVAVGSSISSGAEVIVALAASLDQRRSRRWQLVAIDRRAGVVVHDLSRSVTAFELGNNLEDMRVSGAGTLLALGTREMIQVLEIPGGKTVYNGAGKSPRLSPDGKRLAFISNDRLMLHSFTDGTTTQLLKGKRVKGIGGFSPDGRFLLAGAWTVRFALEKRQIVVDMTTGDYAVIGKLGEGDYGNTLAWVSTGLLH